MQEVDILIIGGGAAGMMAASILAGSEYRIALLEKSKDFGLKVLLTGKGRCNITNMREWKDFSVHVHPDPKFFKTAFYEFSNQDLVSYLNELGLKTKVERGMRVYPESEKSHDVRDTLKFSFLNKMTTCVNAEVFKVTPDATGFLTDYLVGTELCRIHTRRIILTTGGRSYPSTGSTGMGYEIAARLGHTVVPQLPSLTALLPEKYDTRLVGILLKNIKASLEVEGNIVQEEEGELQFTDGGIEGALGFRLSRKAVIGMSNHAKVQVILDLKPALTIAQIEDRIVREKKKLLDKSMVNVKFSKEKILTEILRTMLPKALMGPFLSSNENLTLERLPYHLKNWTFRIVDYVGYSRSVVTMGGISLEEISRKTLESKKVPGLYFAGEVMDLDADTGGYNLQIAFSTGALAARSVMRSLNGSADR